MSELAIVASGLTKTYRVYARPYDRLWEAITQRPQHREHHALSEVSLTVPAGHSLGLIGENGAGKSTLLKILTGITAPTRGSYEVRGSIASILELGSGFHPDFTGRQNIVLNAAMLGLSAPEVRERTPAIVEFSELGEFIDQPVKTYSTGMAMRLGFAIATQVDPDVLIVDEALSVGDGYFQKKCMDRMVELVSAGKTLVFCSHAMYYVSAFCQEALWLRRGRAEAYGPALDVVRAYETYLLGKSSPDAAPRAAAPEAPGPARLRQVRLLGPEGASGTYRPGEPWAVEITWESDSEGHRFHLGVGINRIDEVEVFSCSTQRSGLAALAGRREYRAVLEVPRLPIVQGEFSIYVFLLDQEGLHVYDRRVLRSAFSVASPRYQPGLVDVEHRWEIPESHPALAATRVAADPRA